MATALKQKTEELNLHRLSLEEYHWLIENGFFNTDDNVELIEGVLREMSPKGTKHHAVLTNLRDQFSENNENEFMVRQEGPITLASSESEPEPDLVIAEYKQDYYMDGHPTPEDIFLVIEVAETSIEEDRTLKGPLYAVAGISEYWIINLQECQVEIHQNPVQNNGGDTGKYRTVEKADADSVLAPESFPNCEIDFSKIFPES